MTHTIQIRHVPACTDVALLHDAAGNATTITEDDILYLLSRDGQEMLRDTLARMRGTERKEPLCQPQPIE